MIVKALARAESSLRGAVNSWFYGKDSYSAIKTVVVLYYVVRLVRFIRKIQRLQGIKAYVLDTLIPYIKRLPPVRKELTTQMNKTRTDIASTLHKDLTDPLPGGRLPLKGMPTSDMMTLMKKRKEIDTQYWTCGKISGSIYHGNADGSDHTDFVSECYGMWAFTNPLHPAIHPAVRQMDAEVVQMVVNLFNGKQGEACGAFTTGGTESILMAMKSYRDRGRDVKGITEPNIVVCTTAHAAFDKAGQYFGFFVKKARADHRQAVDVAHVQSLIDENTVAIVGSACQFASGTVDPIEALAKVALAKNVGLHVDCCLGGFLVPFMDKAGFPLAPFDFRVKGVTTISCDPHKYGFAPKGASVLMFHNHELRHHMYSMVTDWTGGVYATAGMCGSRPGGPVAGAWAAMVKSGEEGYVDTCRKIVGATRKIGRAVEDMPELILLGDPQVCVVAFNTTSESNINIYSLADCLKDQSKWELATLQNPPGVHLALTLPSSYHADEFINDLKRAVEEMKAGGKDKYKDGSAGLYGTVAKVPAAFIEGSVAVFLDVTASTPSIKNTAENKE